MCHSSPKMHISQSHHQPIKASSCFRATSTARRVLRHRPRSSPLSLNVVTRPSAAATAIHTVPTGVSGVPPDGPETPDVDTATSASMTLSAPRAISITVCSLTTPQFVTVFGETPSTDCFISVAYDTTPPRTQAELPLTDVRAAMIPPPVQLSAEATVSP